MQRAHLRRNWRIFGIVLLGSLGMSLPVTLLLPAGFIRGFAGGAITATVIALLAFWTVQASGTASTMMGDEAERWTASELRRLRHRGWRLVNHVMWERNDADHVLVGPGGVYVVETKWSSRMWVRANENDRLLPATRQARRSAQSLRLWLRPHGVGMVHPVVMLWGPGTAELPAEHAVRLVDHVTVVVGAHAQRWMAELPQGVLTEGQVESAWQVLDRYVAGRDLREDGPVPLPASTFWRGLRRRSWPLSSVWS